MLTLQQGIILAAVLIALPTIALVTKSFRLGRKGEAISFLVIVAILIAIAYVTVLDGRIPLG